MGDFVYVAGMRGIDPEINTLVPDPEGRVRQAFMNMQLTAESEGYAARRGTACGLRDQYVICIAIAP